ncbi:DNA repair protein RecO [Pararhodospirillum oryzae]|uniref:DNA repair protein RecO n=1 Tax=Pararhodospirillum oryzae TaxID=478448 RepID=A0A512H6S8_9PROT|nr:DNA repair protein RecO [Pararhodospirillum oryzae]GEO81128.1 DNA repair protein RecO [Pararhodospirillum oryzae]
MIAWEDTGIVLSARPHGEHAVLLSLFTATHGRHAGLVPGGQGRALRGTVQPGTGVRALWRARLETHLGTLQVEATSPLTPLLLGERDRLAALVSLCAVAERALPERDPHDALYHAFAAAIASLGAPGDRLTWAAAVARWERDLLEDLGFGLDLGACALTGTPDDLAYVSPRSGRAVSRAAAGPWRDRLLPLPAFLRPETNDPPAGIPAGPADIVAALNLTGHFLARPDVLSGPLGLPAARQRLLDRLRRWEEEVPGP